MSDEFRYEYFSSVKQKDVDWLWYPHIPYGKLTVLQGDPGEGKSTFMLNTAALLTRGKPMPDGFPISGPQTVVYQCSEDDVADTIKPRLVAADADCDRIAYIVETTTSLTLEDEGISGTSLKKRDDFNRMIAACEAGEYDLIVTKSVSRFARNLVDCVSLVRKLKRQNPPVGVFFETDNLNTLSEDSELMLSFLATFAQEESVKKSESMNWSLKQRFKDGKLLTPALLGYERPKDAAGHYIKYAKLQIVESEAEIVRFIFNAFLAGKSPKEIATLLTDIQCPTKTGSTDWHVGSITYILRLWQKEGFVSPRRLAQLFRYPRGKARGFLQNRPS